MGKSESKVVHEVTVFDPLEVTLVRVWVRVRVRVGVRVRVRVRVRHVLVG